MQLTEIQRTTETLAFNGIVVVRDTFHGLPEPSSIESLLNAICDSEVRRDWQTHEWAINEVLKQDPGNQPALASRGLHRLRQGDAGGWVDVEHRKARRELIWALDEWPEWKGESLEGKHILLVGEQGLGDQIMFSRYVPSILALNPRRVTLHIKSELARLMAGFADDGVTIVTDGNDIDSDDLNCWVGLASLPMHFGQLPALPFDTAVARVTLPDTGRLKIGLCWAGNPDHGRDEYRSIHFSMLDPVLNIPGCDFYSLQVGPAAAQNDGRAVDLSLYSHDLAELGGLLRQLDTVVSVDTAVVHLAGALGVKCFMIHGAYLDFRWSMPEKWYESIHLASIDKVCRDLEATAFPSEPKPIEITEPAISVAPTRYGPMKYFTADRWCGRSIAEYGEWSSLEHDIFRTFVKPGDVVVEAGANIGSHSVELWNIVGSGGAVLTFEPNTDSFRLLCENLRLVNRPNNLYEIALGAQEGQLSYRANPSNPGGCTMVPVEESARKCLVWPLDLLPMVRLHFLKADVEGSELDVLKGAEQTIARTRPILYLEADRPKQSEPLMEWLDSHQYRMYLHQPRLFNPKNWRNNPVNVFGSVVSVMILAIPREKFPTFNMQSLGLSRIRLKAKA